MVDDLLPRSSQNIRLAGSSSLFYSFAFVSEVISYTAVLLGLDLEIDGFCGTSSVEQMRTNQNQVIKKNEIFYSN